MAKNVGNRWGVGSKGTGHSGVNNEQRRYAGGFLPNRNAPVEQRVRNGATVANAAAGNYTNNSRRAGRAGR